MTPLMFLKKWMLTPKATLILMKLALLSILALLPGLADAHILVFKRITNELIEEYNDLPALFGPSLPSNGLKVFAIPAVPTWGCTILELPNIRPYPPNAKFVAIIERGGNCSFELKVRNAQPAGFSAVVVYNNNGDDLETMSASNSSGINIPSVFVGHTTGISLMSFFTEEIVVLIDDELPFNINTQLILPFSILVGLCFLVMIFYMIYKCIREERRLRRYRLPKSMLKKLPILKYTKNSDVAHETCVICIEDFVEGDKLRVLPCKHSYHSHCIDPWLTENRRVCPICKRKVFTKGEARSNRNRQTSLDSVTDTDDDTTPLLQPSSNTNNNSSRAGNSRRGRRGNATRSTNSTVPSHQTSRTATASTHHGTFGRTTNESGGNASASVDSSVSDDENVLLTQQSPLHNARRVNPFDRSPNLPPHLAEQLNDGGRRSFWTLPIFRLFRRQQPISIAAPPYLEEVVPHNERFQIGHIAAEQQPCVIATPTSPASMPPSNNILNPNLSGSFKDDDEMPHQSIYEPIATTTPSVDTSEHQINFVTQDENSVFIQTPAQGSESAVALPSPSATSNPSNQLASGQRPGSPSTTANSVFLI